MATPTPRTQMKSQLVASYTPGRTLLSILLCELFCGRGMETSHFPSPSRGRERYRASGHEVACAGDTRLFARAEAARVTAMLLLVASGSRVRWCLWRVRYGSRLPGPPRNATRLSSRCS
jgi:hypothetical protein